MIANQRLHSLFNTCTTGRYRPILTIGENVIRACYFFEFPLRLVSVLRILVWMPAQRQFAISVNEAGQRAAASLIDHNKRYMYQQSQ